MSELIQTHDNRATIRWKLLTGVSALALTAYISSIGLAKADDADHPLVWIEIGGQMEALQGFSSPFVAPFMLITPTPDPYKNGSPIENQSPPRFALGMDGKISFQPKDSDWIFSAGIRYGRSHKHLHVHHQTAVPPITVSFYGSFFTFPQALKELADTKAQHSEHHTILDFSAGKDIGVGLLGREGSSNITMGARFAQFSVRSNINVTARPFVGATYPTYYHIYPLASYSSFAMQARAERSFKGVGPSLSWNGSAALAGNKQDGELTLDFGINAAVLFGKQKAKTNHATQAYHFSEYHVYKYHTKLPLYAPRSHHSTRSRSVTVPNIGGYAGLSVKYTDVKVSVGYRYDTFLNALDTGIDVAKKSNVTFNGPYASISIGLGD